MNDLLLLAAWETNQTKHGVIYEVTLTVKRSGSGASRGDAWMGSVW
jgi:hypothetical protein